MVEDLKEWLGDRCPRCHVDPDEQITLKEAKYDYAQELGVSSETTRRWLKEITSEAGSFYVDEAGCLMYRLATRCAEHSTHTQFTVPTRVPMRTVQVPVQ